MEKPVIGLRPEMLSDSNFEDMSVTEVRPQDEAIVVVCGSMALLVANETGADFPEPGDTIRLWGEGPGRPVRGVAVLRPDGEVDRYFYYRTQAEENAKHAEWVASRKEESRKRFEAAAPTISNRIASLPQEFQDRFAFFMRNSEWGAEFAEYELFVCEEAIEIGKVCRTPDEFKQFFEQPSEMQKRMASRAGAQIRFEEHSGNTFVMAGKLAYLYLTRPELLRKMHGALCGLVGCEDYGCWSATPEAAAEREKLETGADR